MSGVDGSVSGVEASTRGVDGAVSGGMVDGSVSGGMVDLDALVELDWREPVGHDYAVCRLTAISWLVHRHGLLPEQRQGD